MNTRRIWIYLRSSYPPLPRLAVALVSYYALTFSFSTWQRPGRLEVTWCSLVGAVTFFLFLLFLRVSDEIKDFNQDRQLFPERPHASGRVLKSDLSVLWALVLGLIVILNLLPGRAAALCFPMLIYSLLMFFQFFAPRRISANLLLQLVTHNPVIFLLQLYALSIACVEHRIGLFPPAAWGLALLFWLPGLTWELGRKTRAPAEETAYMTYSRLCGWRPACWVVLLLAGLSAAGFGMLYCRLRLSWIGPLATGLGFCVVIFFGARFLIGRGTGASLRHALEGYYLVSLVGLVLALGLKYPVTFRL